MKAEGKATTETMLTHRYAFTTLAKTYEQEAISNPQLIKGVNAF